MLLSRSVIRIFSIGMMCFCANTVWGQDYPSKTIRLVTASAGGGSDFSARLVAQEIAGPLGQPVIVDNRGSCVLAGENVSKALPDGYTLMLCGASTWVSPLLRKAPYDVVNDFSPISLVVREILILAVHPSLPVKSVKELIALAKAKPGELNYASGSPGSPPHLGVELFNSMAGANIVRVAYKGSAPGITALINGEVQLTIYDPGLVIPHVKTGRLRALAVTSADESALAPGLPTVAASGLPGYELVGMTGVFAPSKTPRQIITRLNQGIVRAVKKEDVKEKFFDSGAEIVASSPEQFAAMIKSDMAKMGKVIKDAGIHAD